MTLAIFDLDNTLIGGDSDHAWGEFVANRGIVDATDYRRRNDAFYEDYQRGALDVVAYQRFALSPLKGVDPQVLRQWHADFMATVIRPLMLPKAQALVNSHREQGHDLLIITATNRFITGPIAAELGINTLIATEPEVIDGRYTGDIVGIPCYQHGKVERLHAWMEQQGKDLAGSWFYSDSANDLPLLERVDHPVAVDADARLTAVAKERGWKIMSLR